MFSFFKKKPPVSEVGSEPAALQIGGDVGPDTVPVERVDGAVVPADAAPVKRGWLGRLRDEFLPGLGSSRDEEFQPTIPVEPEQAPGIERPVDADLLRREIEQAPPTAPVPDHAPAQAPAPAQPPVSLRAPTQAPMPMPVPVPVPSPFPAYVPPEPKAPPSSFKPSPAPALKPPPTPAFPPAPELPPEPVPADPSAPAERRGWLDKLRNGLRRTGSSIAQVFTGTQIDDALYEELESALLMADAGVKATEYLLEDLKGRVKDVRASDPAQVKKLLVEAITSLLKPLEKSLQVGEFTPTVFMVVGVNGAGKTTSIGKLTAHLALAKQKVLLAAADTFRAAAREQLEIWADRNQVEVISQQGGDPAAVSFDAVTAGKARGCDVVIADTAGRLPTQLHLMEELKKIKRVIAKADTTSPHEILLVVDGNTGQNALTQVKAFDDALGLTGLIVTKLDGTAKGGVLAAIARERPVPVYFIGVGEKLEDLQTFDAREFAQALLT